MGTALNTDLYELTMAQSFLEQGKTGPAVFSLFCRTLPRERNFLISCGLSVLIQKLEAFRFGNDDLGYLAGLGTFSDEFLDWLRRYRFRGSLSAVPEGTVVFQNEPLVQIEGSLPEVQILETLVLNTIMYQTMAASKAARIVGVARNKPVIDFGFRRAHMTEAGVLAARAAYIAGFFATSNLEAGKQSGIPVAGTMAHSYIMVFPREDDAFTAFSSSFPDKSIFLIDTFDTLAGAEKIVSLARSGVSVTGVRIDSGDIGTLATAVRKILDKNGLEDIKIFASSNVDEYAIAEWLGAGVPIDSFGVGTRFITSSDAPYLDIVYKLVEYEGRPMFKTSPGKATFPFKRQIVRHAKGGRMTHDEVVRMDSPENTPGLVTTILRRGAGTGSPPSVDEIRALATAQIASLPAGFMTLEKREYPVRIGN
ncbi:MAG TPA: nicotinate phosphoribosyltransferase [Methanoregulaceae archaeon]|nr:nicotinate phosphoribosyltransferase [Methanoregulaceae archaeon]